MKTETKAEKTERLRLAWGAAVARILDTSELVRIALNADRAAREDAIRAYASYKNEIGEWVIIEGCHED